MHSLISPHDSLVNYALDITTCWQNFEALTPNLAARTMETVEGRCFIELNLSHQSTSLCESHGKDH